MKSIRKISLLIALTCTLGATSFINGMVTRPYSQITYKFKQKPSIKDRILCSMCLCKGEAKAEKTYEKNDIHFNAAYKYLELLEGDILQISDRVEDEEDENHIEISVDTNYYWFINSINTINKLLIDSKLHQNNKKTLKSAYDLDRDLFAITLRLWRNQWTERILYFSGGAIITATVCCFKK